MPQMSALSSSAAILPRIHLLVHMMQVRQQPDRNAATAIDLYHLPGDPGRFIGRELDTQIADIVDMTEAA